MGGGGFTFQADEMEDDDDDSKSIKPKNKRGSNLCTREEYEIFKVCNSHSLRENVPSFLISHFMSRINLLNGNDESNSKIFTATYFIFCRRRCSFIIVNISPNPMGRGGVVCTWIWKGGRTRMT